MKTKREKDDGCEKYHKSNQVNLQYLMKIDFILILFHYTVVPGPPTVPKLKMQLKRNLMLEWDEPDDTGGGQLRYNLYKSKTGTDDWELITDREPLSEPRYILPTSSLDVGDYNFRVIGVNVGGLKSDCSQPSDVYTKKPDEIDEISMW